MQKFPPSGGKEMFGKKKNNSYFVGGTAKHGAGLGLFSQKKNTPVLKLLPISWVSWSIREGILYTLRRCEMRYIPNYAGLVEELEKTLRQYGWREIHAGQWQKGYHCLRINIPRERMEKYNCLSGKTISERGFHGEISPQFFI